MNKATLISLTLLFSIGCFSQTNEWNYYWAKKLGSKTAKEYYHNVNDSGEIDSMGILVREIKFDSSLNTLQFYFKNKIFKEIKYDLKGNQVYLMEMKNTRSFEKKPKFKPEKTWTSYKYDNDNKILQKLDSSIFNYSKGGTFCRIEQENITYDSLQRFSKSVTKFYNFENNSRKLTYTSIEDSKYPNSETEICENYGIEPDEHDTVKKFYTKTIYYYNPPKLDSLKKHLDTLRISKNDYKIYLFNNSNKVLKRFDYKFYHYSNSKNKVVSYYEVIQKHDNNKTKKSVEKGVFPYSVAKPVYTEYDKNGYTIKEYTEKSKEWSEYDFRKEYKRNSLGLIVEGYSYSWNGLDEYYRTEIK